MQFVLDDEQITEIRKAVFAVVQDAVVDGRKLYGKQSITQWLKAHETRLQEQEKKLVTSGVATSSK